MERQLGVLRVSGAAQCIVIVLFGVCLFDFRWIYSRRLEGSASQVFQRIAANGESGWIIATRPTLCSSC